MGSRLNQIAEEAAKALGYQELKRPFIPYSIRDWRLPKYKHKKREYHPGVVVFRRLVMLLFRTGTISIDYDQETDIHTVYRKGDIHPDELRPIHQLMDDANSPWHLLADSWRADARKHARNWAYRRIPEVGEHGTTRKDTQEWSQTENQESTPTPTFGKPETGKQERVKKRQSRSKP